MYSIDRTVTLAQGQSADIGTYRIEYLDIEQNVKTDFLQTRADLLIHRNGVLISHLKPILNQFEANQDVITVPAVRSSIKDDLYIILAGWSDEGESATFQVHINPLINLVWFGGILFLAGAYLALTPQFSKRSHKRWYSYMGVGLLLLSFWAIWGIPRGVENTKFSRPVIGSTAPTLNDLRLIDGSELNTSDLQYKTVVVNFWAPWCPSCREELPALQEIWQDYSDRDVIVIGIAYESDLESTDKAIDTYSLTYPVVMDEKNNYSKMFAVTGVPETYIIDPDGLIRYARIGAVDRLSMEETIKEILLEEGETY